MTLPPTGFVRLRVADVDPLTADSVALTFDVPPEHAEASASRPAST